MLKTYSVIVCGVWVLVTSNDLRRHPIRSADEGVSSPHCPVQLSADTKVHWMDKWYNQSMWCKLVFLYSTPVNNNFMRSLGSSPSLTSAFSVSRTFWPLMSRWMTWWACKWARPWRGERERETYRTWVTKRKVKRGGEEKRMNSLLGSL